jgi:hypothetical protein
MTFGFTLRNIYMNSLWQIASLIFFNDFCQMIVRTVINSMLNVLIVTALWILCTHDVDTY